MKKVFTTGQVAKICKVAPRTVSTYVYSATELASDTRVSFPWVTAL